MMFDIINSLGRLILTIVVIVKLSQYRGTMNAIERIGLGLMGGGSFLTVAVIWERETSPFEGWSVTVLTYGAILFLAGRTARDWRHAQHNKIAARDAREYLRGRGKL